ncbi:MAG: hypothetical protein JWR69_1129 [Pedosphaera sp.]|nr:hypothetical protein [Pedosphaera sp.]
MKQDPIEEGRISENSQGVGTVTMEMVLARARELAIINGRGPHEVLDSDLEQARRELTTEEEDPPAEADLDSVPESERWDPVPGSSGTEAVKMSAPDDQTKIEKIVQEGLDDAEHDQMLQASKEAARRDEET